MGVQGFTTYLSNVKLTTNAGSTTTNLVAGDTLLIDGSAWCFHLCQNFGELSARALDKNLPCTYYWGGAYSEFDALITERVKALRRFGLNLRVYADGGGRKGYSSNHVTHQEPLPPTAEGTRFKDVLRLMQFASQVPRMVSRALEWTILEQWCYTGTNPPGKNFVDGPQYEFPLPPLLVAQFYATMAQLDVPLVTCPDEADLVLARDSCETGGYILTNDTDLMFYRETNVIFCRDLDVALSSKPHRTISVRTSSSADLSRSMLGSACDGKVEDSDMGEENYARWADVALVIGNDYSSHVHLDELFDAVGYPSSSSTAVALDLPPRPANRNIGSVLAWAKTLPVDWTMENALKQHHIDNPANSSSREAFIAEIVVFSTALYLNKPYVPLQPAALDKHIALKQVTGIKNAANLRMQQSVLWVQFDLNMDKVELPDIAWSALHTCINLGEASIRACADLFPDIMNVGHQHALKQMLNTLGSPNYVEVSRKEKPIGAMWEAVLAGQLYQKMISRLVSNSPEDTSLTVTPSKLFDVHLFHHFLRGDKLMIQGGSGKAGVGTTSQRVPRHNCRSVDYLPIDDYEGNIVSGITQSQVSIVQGENGCGKSLRVPYMLLSSSQRSGKVARIIISQPNHIACKTIFGRLPFHHVVSVHVENDQMNVVDEVREAIQNGCVIHCMTSGYLARLMADEHSVDLLNNITHIIIDEVHERNLETELLCFQVRTLLTRQPNTRLVLMSATPDVPVYQNYFAVHGKQPKLIYAGKSRHPVVEYYSDSNWSELKLGHEVQDLAAKLSLTCTLRSSIEGPSKKKMQKMQQDLAIELTRKFGRPSSAVLIFVTKPSDIENVRAAFERVEPPSWVRRPSEFKFVVIGVHQHQTVESQMKAFCNFAGNIVKVLVATSTAAQSSLTFPDVDTVICFGSDEQQVYDARNKSTTYVPRWVSQSAAVQRSGRTGRMRPGKVFRLYTATTFKRMDKHTRAETDQQPLAQVILKCRDLLGNAPVKDVLAELIDPCKPMLINHSYKQLYDDNLVTNHNDTIAQTTLLGQFVSALGIDPHLGRLIGAGMTFGVYRQSVVLAAVLSTGVSPFRMSSPKHDSTEQVNSTARSVVLAYWGFDQGLHSEPLTVMRIFFQYERLIGNKKPDVQHKRNPIRSFLQQNSLNQSRMDQLVWSVRSLSSRVAATLVKMERRNGMGIFFTPTTVKSASMLDPEAVCMLRWLMVLFGADKVFKFKNAIRPLSLSELPSTSQSDQAGAGSTLLQPAGSRLTKKQKEKKHKQQRQQQKVRQGERSAMRVSLVDQQEPSVDDHSVTKADLELLFSGGDGGGVHRPADAASSSNSLLDLDIHFELLTASTNKFAITGLSCTNHVDLVDNMWKAWGRTKKLQVACFVHYVRLAVVQLPAADLAGNDNDSDNNSSDSDDWDFDDFSAAEMLEKIDLRESGGDEKSGFTLQRQIRLRLKKTWIDANIIVTNALISDCTGIFEANAELPKWMDVVIGYSEDNMLRSRAFLNTFEHFICVNFGTTGCVDVVCASVGLTAEDMEGAMDEDVQVVEEVLKSKTDIYFPVNVPASLQASQQISMPPLGIQLLGIAANTALRTNGLGGTVLATRLAKAGMESTGEGNDIVLNVGIEDGSWRRAFTAWDRQCSSVNHPVQIFNPLSVARLLTFQPISNEDDVSGLLSLYAVAGVMVDHQRGPSRAKWVTVLPQLGKCGADWVLKAMLCGGSLRSLEDCEESSVDYDTEKLCLSIGNKVRSLGTIEYDEQLRTDVLNMLLV